MHIHLSNRSGKEEEYSELQQYLEDIASYMRDVNAIQAASRAAKRKRLAEDKKKGEDMRRAAMEGQASKLCNVSTSSCIHAMDT